jgi:hypothetical protein
VVVDPPGERPIMRRSEPIGCQVVGYGTAPLCQEVAEETLLGKAFGLSRTLSLKRLSSAFQPLQPSDHGAEHSVLDRQVLLDLHRLVEHGIGVVVGGLGALVGRGGQHVLAHDDH